MCSSLLLSIHQKYNPNRLFYEICLGYSLFAKTLLNVINSLIQVFLLFFLTKKGHGRKIIEAGSRHTKQADTTIKL